MTVGNGDTLNLGAKTLRIVLAPWVHYWDSLVVYDETDKLLFSSDLFMQMGDREPVTEEDRSDEVAECARFFGLLPSQAHLNQLLDRVEPLEIETLACHHGSVLQGDPAPYYQALRQSAADIVDAPFYEMQGVARPERARCGLKARDPRRQSATNPARHGRRYCVRGASADSRTLTRDLASETVCGDHPLGPTGGVDDRDVPHASPIEDRERGLHAALRSDGRGSRRMKTSAE